MVNPPLENIKSSLIAVSITSQFPKLKILKVLIFCVYPVYVMWPLFSYQINSHLVFGLTDADGGIQLAAVLSHLDLPWSINYFTDFPQGASIWRIQNFSQLIMILFLWFVSQIVSAPLSISIFIFLGWVTSGLVAYMVGRELGVSVKIAIFSGVAVQLLPIFRINGGNYVTYVWLSVPLLLILFLMRYSKNPKIKNLFAVCVVLVGTAFFDAYWFYFSLLICLTAVVFSGKQGLQYLKVLKPIGRAVLLFWAFVATGLYSFFFVWVTRPQDPFDSSRGISVVSKQTVSNSAGKLQDFAIRPWSRIFGGDVIYSRPNAYLGVSLILLAVVAVCVLIKKRENIGLVAVTIVLVALTLKPELVTPLGVIPMPSGLFRYLSPGLQYPVRAGFIASVLMVILAGYGLNFLFQYSQRKAVAFRLTLVLFPLIVFVDLNPNAQRDISREFEKYQEIQTILAADENAVVMAVPELKSGRSWHEQWMFNVPFGNSMYDSSVFEKLDKQITNGAPSAAAYLNEQGIRYLYTFKDFGATEFGFDLVKPRFTELATVQTFNYENGLSLMALYKVTAQPGDSPCSACVAIPKLQLNEWLSSDDKGKSYWNQYKAAEIKGYMAYRFGSLGDYSKTMIVSFTLFSLNEQVIEMRSLNGIETLLLSPGTTYEFQKLINWSNPLRIESKKPCAVPQELDLNSRDPRGLCFNIADLTLFPMQD